MTKVRVDRGLCEAYANCVFHAPHIFDLDEEDVAVLRVAEISATDRASVDQAVASCPVGALSIEPA